MFSDPIIPLVYSKYQSPPPEDKLIFLFSPHCHYVYNLNKGIIYNVFPPGLSLLLYPFLWIGGRSTVFYVIPCLNIIFLFISFYLASKFVNIFFGILFASFIFFNYQIFMNTIIIMSDVPSMIMVSSSLFLLYFGLIKNRKIFVVLAGIFFGFSILLRYSNLVSIVPLFCIFLLFFIKEKKFKKVIQSFIYFTASTFIFGIIPLLIYTYHLFGTVFRLVYEPITQSKMQLVNVPEGVLYYLKAIYENFGPLGVSLSLIGLIACLLSRKRKSIGIVCASGIVSFLIFYSFHSIHHSRYLIPIFPLLAAMAGFAVLTILEKLKTPKLLKLMLVLLLASYPLIRSIPSYHLGNIPEEKISFFLKKRVENNSVILCDSMSGPLRLYADISTLKFKWTKPSILMETISILIKEGFPVYFLLDSDNAKSHFDFLIKKEFLKLESLKTRQEINGIPFYKFR